MDWLRKRVKMRPLVVLAVVVGILLAGSGVAVALDVHNVLPSTEPWAGTSSITESGNLTVSDYSLVYTANLTQVSAVDINVTNSDASHAHDVDIEIAILDYGETVQATGSATGVNVGASSTITETITLSSYVALADLDTLNIIITETS
jgi:hypothetical protein